MVWTMKKAKRAPMQKPMTVAEMRKLLAQKQKQLDQCIAYNEQWRVVAQGLERQKNELLDIVKQQQAELDHWKALITGGMVRQ